MENLKTRNHFNQKYQGWTKWYPTDAELADFFMDRSTCPIELRENEYLIICDSSDTATAYYKMKNGKIVDICHAAFKSTSENGKVKVINPRNPEQKCAFDMLVDNDSNVKLITGSWGSGKAIPNNTIIPTPTGNKTIGELKVGDYVFDANGKPTKVLGVFPQGRKDVFELSFVFDSRKALCSEDHLWTVYTMNHGKKVANTLTTKQLIEKGVYKPVKGQNKYKFQLPIVKPVEYSYKEFEVDPYVVGSFIGNGCTAEQTLTLSSNDGEQVQMVADLLGSPEVIRNSIHNYNHVFRLPLEKRNGIKINFHTKEVFKNLPEVIGKSHEKRIPKQYLYGSVEQRYALLQGLLDTDGTVSYEKGRISYHTTSKDLVDDILELCFSLGLCANYSVDTRLKSDNSHYCYRIGIRTNVNNKENLFRLKRKKDRCIESKKVRQKSQCNYLSIKDIKKLDYQEEMTCIYVDNEEHLFLMNDYIVTHNTIMLITAGLQALKDKKFDKIVWIRNNVDVKDTKDLGALPGEVNDKLLPFLGPFIDHAGGNRAVTKMLELGQLVVEPLQFLRGRNLENTLILCSESENLTKEHIQLIIARCAEGSQVWFDGDTVQRDKKSFEESRGIERMVDSLAGNSLFAYINLTKVERSATASLADKIN